MVQRTCLLMALNCRAKRREQNTLFDRLKDRVFGAIVRTRLALRAHSKTVSKWRRRDEPPVCVAGLSARTRASPFEESSFAGEAERDQGEGAACYAPLLWFDCVICRGAGCIAGAMGFVGGYWWWWCGGGLREVRRN